MEEVILNAKKKAKYKKKELYKVSQKIYEENKELFMEDVKERVGKEVEEGKYYSMNFYKGTYYVLKKFIDENIFEISCEIEELIVEDLKSQCKIVMLGGFPHILFKNNIKNNLKLRIEYFYNRFLRDGIY